MKKQKSGDGQTRPPGLLENVAQQNHKSIFESTKTEYASTFLFVPSFNPEDNVRTCLKYLKNPHENIVWEAPTNLADKESAAWMFLGTELQKTAEGFVADSPFPAREGYYTELRDMMSDAAESGDVSEYMELAVSFAHVFEREVRTAADSKDRQQLARLAFDAFVVGAELKASKNT